MLNALGVRIPDFNNTTPFSGSLKGRPYGDRNFIYVRKWI
jgi:hypothetical protein